MAEKREHSRTFAEIVAEVPETLRDPHQISPLNVIVDQEWLDEDGRHWHMRGAALDLKQARRMLERPDINIAHFDCYGPDAFVTGSARDALIDRVQEFLEAGPVGGGNGFQLAEFRDDEGNVTLV